MNKYTNENYERYGSVAIMSGKTIIVSIFASDTDTQWDFSNKEDNELANIMLKRLSLATEWLSECVLEYGVEAEFIYDWAKGSELVYAHEIMHCFGANDLYYENKYISQSYVDYCKTSNSKDIMYSVYDCEEIKNLFSTLDAYYMGITDYCEDVKKYNLRQSNYITD